MTVTISKPAINIREKLTEASAVVPYEQRQFYFDNLVTNGTFDTDTSGWTAQNSATASVVGGELEVVWNASNSQMFYTLQGLADGTYVVSVDAYRGTANSYDIRIGDNVATTTYGAALTQTNTASTTHVFYANVSNGLLYIFLRLNSFTVGDTAYFDNISVYTSDGTDVAFTMPKGWKPLHVYDDGVLQREGSAEDYEVTFDGFHYYVKPTVANPGARNTVIGVRA